LSPIFYLFSLINNERTKTIFYLISCFLFVFLSPLKKPRKAAAAAAMQQQCHAVIKMESAVATATTTTQARASDTKQQQSTHVARPVSSLKSPTAPLKLLENELNSARATLNSAQATLNAIEKSTKEYGSLMEMETREAELADKLLDAKRSMVACDEELQLIVLGVAPASANEREFAQKKKLITERKTVDLSKEREQHNKIYADLSSVKEAATHLREKEHCAHVKSDCLEAVQQLGTALECCNHSMLLKISSLPAISALDTEERKAVKRAADSLANGDTKRIRCIVSSENGVRVGFAAAPSNPPPPLPIVEPNASAKKLRVDDEHSSVDSDDDDDSSATENTTDESANNAVHIHTVLMDHTVCVSSGGGQQRKPHMLLMQREDLQQKIFPEIAMKKWELRKKTILDRLVAYARKGHKLGWHACNSGKQCEFCKGSDLDFVCCSVTKMRESGWERPKRYGGGGAAVKYAYKLSDIITAPKANVRRRKR
jgi:hypothetical protein